MAWLGAGTAAAAIYIDVSAPAARYDDALAKCGEIERYVITLTLACLAPYVDTMSCAYHRIYITLLT